MSFCRITHRSPRSRGYRETAENSRFHDGLKRLEPLDRYHSNLLAVGKDENRVQFLAECNDFVRVQSIHRGLLLIESFQGPGHGAFIAL